MDPTLPKGYRYAGTACGIKPSGSTDLTLIVADQACIAAGVYTQNVVRASSIDWNQQVTPGDQVRAIVVNSGNANACTGEPGIRNTAEMAKLTAAALDGPDSVTPEQVLVLSTGVIGVQLPMDKIQAGIAGAASQLENDWSSFTHAIDGIRTTDKDRKFATHSLVLGEQAFQLAGMAKGAGMIGPRMATMLSVIVTDFPLAAEQAQHALTMAVDQSFNRISVEGHTSTNDAVILLCRNPQGTEDVCPESVASFGSALTQMCIELAKLIPADGEGATHLIEVQVQGTADDMEADRIARTVGASNLVKTAITGADPNWGRIVSAIGILDVDVVSTEISLTINGHAVFRNGEPLAFDASVVSQSMREQFETQLQLVVGKGQGRATHWTSDLTVDYVKFNSEYTT